MKPIHTNEYSVTQDGILFGGYFVRKLSLPVGYYDVHWVSGFTQIPCKEVFGDLEDLESFFRFNKETHAIFKKVKKYIKTMDGY